MYDTTPPGSPPVQAILAAVQDEREHMAHFVEHSKEITERAP